MKGGLSAEEVERLVAAHAERAGTPVRTQPGPVWLMVLPHGARVPEQGWKLHVSSRITTLGATADAILPALLAEGCAFKLARSSDALARLNDGTTTPSSIGKAFTVYPEQNRVREVGLLLARLLQGWAAPRVLSDRRVAPDAPVYYRYGPIDKPWTADAQGKLVLTLTGPDGEEFPALATQRYRQPAWAVDPFTGERGRRARPARPDQADPPTLLGDHFQIDGGIVHAGRGDVMRAVDLRDGSRVIVKQSRALVDEGEDGVDTRLRVRNERRVLAALRGVEGVAGYVDHFRTEADEFLVTRDVGRFNLADDVVEHGRYAAAGEPGAVPGRTLERLAERMAGVILAVHGRGVLIRDLNPRNVVIGPDGAATLIDLGLAGFNGLHLPGGTSGYSSARQFRHQEPTTGDDLVALGATLLYAWSALPPVVLSADVDEPRRAALRMIRARCGESPAGVLGLICDLLSMDDARAHDAARRMAAGAFATAAPTRTPLPPSAPVSEALVAEITGNVLADLMAQTRRVLTEVPRHEKVGVDGCVYRGGAGIGLELLEHLDTPGTAELAAGLVRFSEAGADVVGLGPGLWTGRTGLDYFRLSARRRLPARMVHPAPGWGAQMDWKPEYCDLISGASGVGLGHLLLHDLDGRAEHLDVARACAEHVLANTAPDETAQPGTLPEPAGVEPSAAKGHGLAGTVDALAAIGARLGDTTILAAADERARDLMHRSDRLVAKSRRPTTVPLAASWCQGLSGIASSLLMAGDHLGEPQYVAAARRAADACIALIPRVDKPVQCCGLAGIGNMLIDVAAHDDDEKYWDAAHAVAAQMLLRSAGPADHPVFVKNNPTDYSASWAYGLAGILGFFRRLSRHGGPTALTLTASAAVLH
ncbi:lanthionine synthetase LanC family protein [Catenulispora subtropica]|uniref:non-specific serine/threonine protein kinase n=1 Tax=Catenulispora subtropica TaxID=450798 RepID=A0ABP5EEH7_9ACTN